jgi:Methyltransferase FkbM domain
MHKRFQIDYLSIDVEGGESEILKHLDFNRFDIGALTVEHGHSDDRIFETMKASGYRLAAILCDTDALYVKNHHD